jgi:hypothetical protein
VLLAFTWNDAGDLALAIFLIALGVGLFYAFFRLGELFHRLGNLVKGAQREVLPVIAKVGGTVDRVNDQLLKVDTMSDSAVDAVQSVDRAVRAVSYGVATPVQKAVGIATGLKFGVSAFRVDHDWRAAVAEAKLDAGFYIFRDRSHDTRLPWDIIDGGLKTSFFRSEYAKSTRAEWTLPPKRAAENARLLPMFR